MSGYSIDYFLGFLFVPLLVMAIIGGIYYLIARPRETFLQAMFTWWVVLIAVIILILSVLGQIARKL